MKTLILRVFSVVLVAFVALSSVSLFVHQNVGANDYFSALGNTNHNEKITGEWLVKTAALRNETVTIYGSSELRTYDIPTHPANFFARNPAGFQINLVGRGSCQSLIHALSIAAVGESLAGTRVVLITSPQSFVEGGIAPDLFMANFSEQQYLNIMASDRLSEDIKLRFSQRVSELFAEYEVDTGRASFSAAALLAKSTVEQNMVARVTLTPFFAASRWLVNLKDVWTAGKLLESESALFEETSSPENIGVSAIYWEDEAKLATEQAMSATSNNDFGILDGYYNTYIGARLERQQGKDADLSYSVSEEYDDLELLMDVCKVYGINPIFVHVPLHGEWSDYTGFAAERRAEYYQNVRDIVAEYENVTLLDLTGFEYEDYFLSDIMHLGWKGWLEFDKALVEIYSKG